MENQQKNSAPENNNSDNRNSNNNNNKKSHPNGGDMDCIDFIDIYDLAGNYGDTAVQTGEDHV